MVVNVSIFSVVCLVATNLFALTCVNVSKDVKYLIVSKTDAIYASVLEIVIVEIYVNF